MTTFVSLKILFRLVVVCIQSGEHSLVPYFVLCASFILYGIDLWYPTSTVANSIVPYPT